MRIILLSVFAMGCTVNTTPDDIHVDADQGGATPLATSAAADTGDTASVAPRSVGMYTPLPGGSAEGVWITVEVHNRSMPGGEVGAWQSSYLSAEIRFPAGTDMAGTYEAWHGDSGYPQPGDRTFSASFNAGGVGMDLSDQGDTLVIDSAGEGRLVGRTQLSGWPDHLVFDVEACPRLD